MDKPQIANKTVWAFVAAGVAGLILLAILGREGDYEATLGFRSLTGAQALADGRAFIQAHGRDLTGYQSELIFDDAHDAVDFLTRHFGPTDANTTFRDVVPAPLWKTRWSKLGENAEYTVAFGTNGRLAFFSRRAPKASDAADLDEFDAQANAAAFLQRAARLDLEQYELIEHSAEVCDDRAIWQFVWRRKDFAPAGAEFLAKATVVGDVVTRYECGLNFPEAWRARQKASAATNKILLAGKVALMALLSLAALIALVWLARARQVRWRASFAVAGAVGAAALALGLSGATLAAKFEHEARLTLGMPVALDIIMGLLFGVFFFLAVLVLFGGMEALGRRGFGGWPLAMRGLSWRELLFGPNTPRQFLLGYALAAAQIGFVIAFYAACGQVAGVQWPVDYSADWNIASVPLAFASFFYGAVASLSEELLFRVLLIALLLRLTRRPWAAIVGSALAWGFPHCDVIWDPFWIRSIEVTLIGLAYGAIFLRYGLLVTLVSHFAFDCSVLSAGSLLYNGRPGPVAAAVLAVAAPLLLLLPRLFRRPAVPAESTADVAAEPAGEPVAD
jgi:membrane protease YdiL (CAAX protease family)